MKPLESMLLQMKPLGLYDLGKDGSLVRAELSACADALQLAYDGLLELEREAYFASAQDWGFSGKCAWLGIADGGEHRRTAGLALLRIRPDSFTRADFLQAAEALGLGGPLYECFAQRQVLLCPSVPPDDREFAARMLRRLLPAHLTVRTDLRGKDASWAALDAQAQNWTQYDAQAETWGEREKDVVFF